MINVLDFTVSSVSKPGWTDIVEDQTGLMTVYVNVGKSGWNYFASSTNTFRLLKIQFLPYLLPYVLLYLLLHNMNNSKS